MTTTTLDHRERFPLPWTLPDNGSSWLEPTSACNLACDGCYRRNEPDSHMRFDWRAGRDRVDRDRIWYHSDSHPEVELRSGDVVGKIREIEPDFAPAAYPNGTGDPSAMKWLLAQRIGTKSAIYGYPEPKFVELLSGLYHVARSRYLSYVSPGALRRGLTALLFLGPFGRGLRRASARYLGALLRSPLRPFRRVHLQSVMIIQPVDFTANGAQSMCDGCPDLTVHDGKLVWICRLEELKQFGCCLRCVPRS